MFDSDSIFKKTVERALVGKSKRTASSKVLEEDLDAKFESSYMKTILSFDSIKKNFPRASIQDLGSGNIRVAFGASIALNVFSDLFNMDNEDVDLEFTEDLLNFKPDPTLINKSSVPLWVCKMDQGQKSVQLKRMW